MWINKRQLSYAPMQTFNAFCNILGGISLSLKTNRWKNELSRQCRHTSSSVYGRVSNIDYNLVLESFWKLSFWLKYDTTTNRLSLEFSNVMMPNQIKNKTDETERKWLNRLETYRSLDRLSYVAYINVKIYVSE